MFASSVGWRVCSLIYLFVCSFYQIWQRPVKDTLLLLDAKGSEKMLSNAALICIFDALPKFSIVDVSFKKNY